MCDMFCNVFSSVYCVLRCYYGFIIFDRKGFFVMLLYMGEISIYVRIVKWLYI